MKYELAKELKEAGFPQLERHWYWSDHTSPPTLWCINAYEDITTQGWEIYAVPTLEELLAACGDHFVSLQRHVGNPFNYTGIPDSTIWWSAPQPAPRGGGEFVNAGASPEEASPVSG